MIRELMHFSVFLKSRIELSEGSDCSLDSRP